MANDELPSAAFSAKISNRRWPTVALLLANLVSLPVLLAVMMYPIGASPALWPLVLLGGCITGQATVLAVWFGLAREPFWFRTLILVVALVAFHSSHSLFNASRELVVLQQQNPDWLKSVSWPSFAWYLAVDIGLGLVWGVALYLLVWLILLPLRRWKGVSLGTAFSADAARTDASRQFHILDLMKYTGLVALFLLLLRLISASNPLMAGALILMSVSLMGVGWIVFRAAMSDRHPAPWFLGTVALLGTMAFLLCEGAWLIDKTNGTNIRSMLDLRAIETFLVGAAAAIGLNAWMLRKLQLRLHWGSKAERAGA